MKLLVTTLAIALFQIPVFAQEVLEHRDFKIAQICYEKAKDHFDYAQYDSALYYFSRAIKFNPNNSDYFLGELAATTTWATSKKQQRI